MSGGQRSKLLSSSTVFVSDHLRLRKNEKTCKFVRFEQVKTRQAFSDISKKLEEKSVNDFGRQFFIVDVLTLMKEINILMDTSQLLGSRHEPAYARSILKTRFGILT